MPIVYGVGAFVAVALLIYLGAALFKPEWF